MLKKKEIFIIIAILMLCIGMLIIRNLIEHNNTPEKKLVVTSKNEIVLEAPLSENLIQKIDCEKGYNIIIIENGLAFVQEADCANQICVHSAKISEPGETIACLPHRLLLEIQTP